MEDMRAFLADKRRRFWTGLEGAESKTIINFNSNNQIQQIHCRKKIEPYSGVFLQRQKRMVIYYVKQFVKESQWREKQTLCFQKIGIIWPFLCINWNQIQKPNNQNPK